MVNRFYKKINYHILVILGFLFIFTNVLMAETRLSNYNSYSESNNYRRYNYNNDDYRYNYNSGRSDYRYNNKKIITKKKPSNYQKHPQKQKKIIIKTKKKKKSKNAIIKKKIPSKTRTINYKIKNGDTLYGISKKYKISIQKLCSVNKLGNKNRIFKGMLLKIPVSINSKKQNKSSQHSPKFNWPIKSVVSYKRDGINGVKSIGLIIKSKPGGLVLSSAKGIVKKIGEMRGFGRYIVVQHQNRYLTVYANLQQIFVSLGDKLTTGKQIGKIKKDNILHFQIDYAGKPKNPLNYLPKKS